MSRMIRPAGDLADDEIGSDASPAMSETAYYGPLGKWVKSLGHHTDIPLPSLYMQLLAVAGAMMGRKRFVNLLSNEQHANLFLLVVGGTGTGRKGSAWNYVKRIALTADPTLGKRFLSGLASGEAMIRLLDECGPQGAVINEGEFSRFLTVKEYSGSTLSERIRAAFDGEPMSHDTKASSMRTEGYHVAIVGHITPDELTKKFKADDLKNGFANRFLWCLSRRTKKIRASESVMPSALLEKIGSQLGEILEDIERIEQLTLTDDAGELFDDIDDSLPDDDSPYTTLMRRGSAYIIRIAAILALCDREDQIDVQHIEAAKAILDYSADSARHILGDEMGSADAGTFLREFLSDGPQPVKIIEEEARHEGITLAQIRAAREKLGISRKAGTIYKGDDGRSVWSLPNRRLKRVV